ncbi:MAG: GFA family protein [Alphaproteobacteria bacterium]|nr:GFA family protein [Alphaproteobacteria bacterium]
MKLEGSCHCGKVRFSLESEHPYPFNLCYCSICRKTAGDGGYAINLGGSAESLSVEGEANISVYQAALGDGETSSGRRNFCKACGSALWLWDPRWPELIHSFASAIDTALPVAPEHTHLMLSSKANWVRMHVDPHDQSFEQYPSESIAAWHQRLGVNS